MVNTMNENGTKRKEWVKNAAIVFLIILLLLTFFSNTIQNYSLPEVATQYVESGSITAKIRGMGVVESGDPYNVKIKEVRQVSSVEVKVGDKVEKGQVLCYLTVRNWIRPRLSWSRSSRRWKRHSLILRSSC